MCQKILRDARLFPASLKIDEELAAEAWREGCSCGGVLHTSNYGRKPRGGVEGAAVGGAQDLRLSYWRDREGCRRRRTPPSVRFLGRKVYLGAVVVLVTAMFQGLTAGRLRRLRELLGVRERTLSRWRKWWRGIFTGTAFWKGARARFSPPVEDAGDWGFLGLAPSSPKPNLFETYSLFAASGDGVGRLSSRYPRGTIRFVVRKSDKRRARISATAASRAFSSLLDNIERGATYIVRRRGRDVCVMTSPPVSFRKASECLEILRSRAPITLDDRFGVDLLGALAGEPIEERPWGS